MQLKGGYLMIILGLRRLCEKYKLKIALTLRGAHLKHTNNPVPNAYKRINERLYDGLLVIDIEQKTIIEANPTYARMSGYTIEELIGKHINTIEANENWQEIQARTAKIIAQGSDVFETTHRRKDGSLMQLEMSVFYFAEKQQNFAFCRDIAAMNELEERLSLAQLSLDQTQDVTLRIDKNARFLYVNDAACHYLGYTKEELLQLSVQDIDPDYTHAVWDAHIKYVNEAGFQRFETRHRRKDGMIVPVEITTTLIKTSHNVCYLAIVRDISERKRTEASLRIAATTFEMPNPILVADAKAKIVRVNSALERITGYSESELLGRKPSFLAKEKSNEEFFMQIWRNLKKEGNWSGEILGMRRDGTTYPAHLTVTAAKDSVGNNVHYVANFTDITVRKQAEEEIRKLAYYDALTGLPNRRLLRDKFEIAMSLSNYTGQYGAIIFLDLDNFKTLNDSLGHDYGDMLLKEVSKRLSHSVRDADTVARFGGDEFVVLLENIGLDYHEVIARVTHVTEKLRSVLSFPYHLNDYVQHSSPSIGVSLFLGNEVSFDEQIKRADIAMYEAKNNGRNNVRFYAPQLLQSLHARVTLETELRNSIRDNQLELFYQIQVNTDRQAIGAEALIRWHHPTRGMVSPAEFIPIAEESSLICDIGDWVLDAACHQISIWQEDERFRQLNLAINISAFQFMRGDFVDKVKKAVANHQINPARLKLELTETVALENIELVIDKMLVLQDTGIQFSLDDFGTGYSSLAYLKRLPVNQVKIDQSFVRDMATNANDAIMVKTIIDLAKNFGLEVIAEGVETEEHIVTLKQQGCTLYQGYLFSKPVPIKDFELLHRQMIEY